MNSLRPRLITTAVALAFAGLAQGQVVFDGRLGPAGPLTAIGGNFAITNAFGTQVGANLFHSFTTFNLATGTVATFSGNPGTLNVVSRVTGGAGSFIDGTLRSTIAGANLWFINPWGVTFGQNAQLDVSGAFHASTASYLVLGSGPGAGRFDAKSPGASVLTAAAPSAFGFLGTPAPLVVDKSFLQVPAGKELSLVGGALDIKGIPGLEGVLLARGGRVNLASAAGAGEIGLGAGGLTASAGMALGEIKLTRSFVITDSPSASALDSGPVYIRGGKLVLADSSAITSGIGSTNSSSGAGGSISIVLSGDLSLNNSEISASVLNPASTAVGGDITVTAGGAITVANNSKLRSSSLGGASGNLSLTAASMVVDDSLVTTSTGGAGAAGNINVQVGDLTLTNGGRIQALTVSESCCTPATGDAGDITVNATGTVAISGAGSGIFSTTTSFGDGGSILVNARNVHLTDGGSIAAEARDPAGITAIAFPPMGDAGDITVNASGSVIMRNATISTFSEESGAGRININAVDTLSLDNSSITTATVSENLAGGGKAGAITIDPVFVILANGSRIDTSGVVVGGGPVSISTQFFMMSPDSLIDTSSTFGAAGTLTINSPNQDSVPGLAALPSGYFDASALLRESCAAKAGRGANSFVGVGRGGLPAGPGSLAFASYALPPAAAAAAKPVSYPELYASLPSACVR